MPNYYKILGVTSTASQEEIKRAYRVLAVKYHPDKNFGDKASEERFKEISESYIILSDIAKRNAYDYSIGYQKSYRSTMSGAGVTTSATYLMLFKNIKNKVFNSGGYVNEYALFKVIDDVLTDRTIEFLIKSDDVYTNNLIIDEILVSCIFLNTEYKAKIHSKLLCLADSDPRYTEKVSVLTKNSDTHAWQESTPTPDSENPNNTSVVLFILLVVFIIVLIIAGQVG